MRRPFLNRPVALLGQSLPMAALLLMAFVVLGSAIGSLMERQGVPALTLAVFSPSLVLGGQIWRLLTWGFFETNGQSLVFGALMLAFLGRDLGAHWGGAKYLGVCAALVTASALLTTLVGFLWADVRRMSYLSVWTLVDALIVGWALLFPNRTILFMLVLPVSGRHLLYLTVGVAFIFSVMEGFSLFVPHFLAMGLMYVYLRGGTAIAAQLKLNRLLSKRTNPGLKVVDGGWNKDGRKDPNDSGWVH